MAEQPAPRAVRRQRDAAHVAAAHAVDAVVRREPLVEIRVVRVEQLEHAAPLAQHVGEQQLRLAAKCGAQVGVEVGILRREVVELAELEPLAGEVLDERCERASASMRATCAASTGGSCELAGGREPRAARRPGCCSRERTTGATRARDRRFDRRRRRRRRRARARSDRGTADHEQPRQRVLDADLEVAAFLAPAP